MSTLLEKCSSVPFSLVNIGAQSIFLEAIDLSDSICLNLSQPFTNLYILPLKRTDLLCPNSHILKKRFCAEENSCFHFLSSESDFVTT